MSKDAPRRAARARHDQRALIPLERFFRHPEACCFQISPDGERVGFLAPWEGRMNVHVRNLASGASLRLTSARARDIRRFAWAGDDFLVYLQDTGGDEVFRLHAVDTGGLAPRALTPEGVKAELVDASSDLDGVVLVEMNARDPSVFDVHRIDLRTGQQRMVAENPGDVTAWLADHDGRVRAAVATHGPRSLLLHRDREEDDLRVISEVGPGDTLAPLLFTFDNRDLYVTSDVGRDRQAIAVFDVRAAGEREVVYQHPVVDVGELLYSRRRRRLTAVGYTTERRRHAFFDEDRRRIQRALERALPGLEVTVGSMSRDERRMVVQAASDRTPGAAYLYDDATGDLQMLAEMNPALDPEAMAPTRSIRCRTRAGDTRQAYLTLPKGADAHLLPIVVYPHGGPWARDTWGYQPEVQLLSSRGYGVLQVSFRGSTGFGKAFCRAGFKEWGRGMQDDLTDCVLRLIAAGIADPARIAIYGESYGGYAALAGLALTPELYACGASLGGISNLLTWMESFPPHWAPFLELMHEMVGHPARDRERLIAASPYFHADAIVAPVLLAHGANDPRVPRGESDRMAEALARRGARVEHLVFDDEGHSLSGEEGATAFYRELERFLAEHIGGEGAPARR